MDFGPDACLFRCTRSDGKKPEDNRCPQDHTLTRPGTEKPWLIKLGEMARSQFYPLEANNTSERVERVFAFEAFPDNYELRVKRRNNDDSRHDYYLYGYPDAEGATQDERRGKKAALKNFRSPAEFWDHLLWLMTDETMNRANCYCKHCRPRNEARDGSQNAGTPPSTSSGPPPNPSAGPGGPSPAPTAGPSSAPRTSSRRGSSTTAASTSTRAASSTAAMAVQPQPDESVLFREGEVVWFRKYQEAFRLGIIMQNLTGDSNNPSSPISKIKPLSHFLRGIEDVERVEGDMRPFLTFSVPAIIPFLQPIADQPMETVPWDSVEAQLPNENMKSEILSLEASKIAATRVDHSYSLFNNIVNPHAPANQLSFGGVFFGCEKLGIFEAVRVRIEQHEHPESDNLDLTFVMVLKNIVLERNDKGEFLFFQGDIWLLQQTNPSQQAPNLDQLPPAMRREKAFRDRVMGAGGVHFDWVPILFNVTKPETSVRGRFYETERLGRMLNPQWDQFLQTGSIPNIQKSLNNRFDSRGSYIGRKKSRLDAVVGAVPQDTVLSLGPRVVEWS